MKKVYLMKCANFYKIGISENPEKRRAAIQTANPLPVELTATLYHIKANQKESELHDLFAEKGVGGEWFKLSNEDLFSLGNVHHFDFSNGVESRFSNEHDRLLYFLIKNFGYLVYSHFAIHQDEVYANSILVRLTESPCYAIYKTELHDWISKQSDLFQLRNHLLSICHFMSQRTDFHPSTVILQRYYGDFEEAVKEDYYSCIFGAAELQKRDQSGLDLSDLLDKEWNNCNRNTHLFSNKLRTLSRI